MLLQPGDVTQDICMKARGTSQHTERNYCILRQSSCHCVMHNTPILCATLCWSGTAAGIEIVQRNGNGVRATVDSMQ